MDHTVDSVLLQTKTLKQTSAHTVDAALPPADNGPRPPPDASRPDKAFSPDKSETAVPLQPPPVGTDAKPSVADAQRALAEMARSELAAEAAAEVAAATSRPETAAADEVSPPPPPPSRRSDMPSMVRPDAPARPFVRAHADGPSGTTPVRVQGAAAAEPSAHSISKPSRSESIAAAANHGRTDALEPFSPVDTMLQQQHGAEGAQPQAAHSLAPRTDTLRAQGAMLQQLRDGDGDGDGEHAQQQGTDIGTQVL